MITLAVILLASGIALLWYAVRTLHRWYSEAEVLGVRFWRRLQRWLSGNTP